MAEWVAVSERLPDFYTPVWLYEPERGVWIGERADDADGWLWGNCYGSEFWSEESGSWWASDNEVDDDYQPTHWHPLPAPPGEAAPEREEGP